MRMPFSHQEPATRMERMRSAVRDGAAGAAHTVSGAATSAAASAAGAAQGAGRTAAGAGRDAAVVVADRAAVAAQQVADRATVAAATMTDRARPIAAEASAAAAAEHVASTSEAYVTSDQTIHAPVPTVETASVPRSEPTSKETKRDWM